MEINCELLNPINLNDGDPDPKLADWEFSNLVCSSEETPVVPFQIITDGENSFNLYPSFSYAEIVIIFFLICFFVFKIFSGTWNFIHTFIIRQKWLR